MSRTPVADPAQALDPVAEREVPVLSSEQEHLRSLGGVGEARVYRGHNSEEMIRKIMLELGPDMIILEKRKCRIGGVAGGFFGRRGWEIEAIAGTPGFDAYDEAPASTPPLPPAPFSGAEHQPAATPFYSREPAPTHPDSEYVAERLAALARGARAEPQPRPSSDVPDFHELAPAHLSDSFSSLLDEASARVSSSPSPASSPSPPTARRGRAQTIRKTLMDFGVSEQFATELLDGAAIHLLPLAPRAGLAQAVRSALIQRISLAPPLPTRGAAITIVGPGGAGKTSCCAALLRAYRESARLPASCATLTRAPEGAELQMLLSPHVMRPTAIDAAQAIRALRKARSEGLLIIDTPPLSPGDRSGIRKLTGLLSALEPERVVIALPATLGAAAAAQLLGALRPLGANALAITHADETDQIGVALEAACTFALAPEYLLDRARSGGWRVRRIDPGELAARLLG
jgi:flagellar biosynthesis GTPase FlhF